MREYKGYNIPERSDFKEKGNVVDIGLGHLTLSLNPVRDDGKLPMLFDTGIHPSKVYDMSEDSLNDLIFSRASSFIDLKY